MDLIKIGKFISSKRKAKELTQLTLAEKLGVTDRAVSKWERGKGLPDASIMLELCEILEISVNELLCGEDIDMENNKEKNEQVLVDVAKEINDKNKVIWTCMWIIMAVSMLALIGGTLAVALFVPEGPLQLVLVIAIVVVFLIPCFFALKLEISVGYYKCGNCGNEIVPTYTQALNAMHLGTTRYLKCPKCGKKSWCKKVINK